MALCIPLIVGPLTEWSDSVLVQGCLPGAHIRISCSGASARDLGEAVANGGIDRVPLHPGERLHVSDRVLVSQKLGNESSEPMPNHLALAVAPAPSDHSQLAPVAILSRVFACGGAIWVAGAVPGAQAKVDVDAVGRANESGDARMSHPGFALGQTITVWQEAPPGFPVLAGTPKQTTASVDKAGPLGSKLPTPVLTAGPPKGCDVSVHVGGIIDGAEVTVLHRADGMIEKAMFDRTELRLDLAKPLPANGDELHISQALIRCREWQDSDPLIVPTGPAAKPKTPAIKPPCPDSYDVYASDLEPGAIVTLTYQSDTYRAMVPQDRTEFVFRLTRLHAGGTVELVQEKCGLASDAASVRVPAPRGGILMPPDLEEPLFGCARAVRAGARPGTWLQVWARGPAGAGPISAQVYCSGGSVQIPVTPYLVPDQDVWLNSLECGDHEWKRSNIHKVQATPHVGPPQITVQLVEGARRVTVDAVPGAYVEVYAFTPTAASPLQMIGSGVVDSRLRTVPLWRPVALKELIYAVQSLCAQKSRPSGVRWAIPNVCTFHLASPLKRMSNQSSSMKPLVCHWATMVCHHDGRWYYTAELENQETEADCSFDLQFDLLAATPAFGAPLKGDLSASGSGPITQTGMRAQGIPERNNFSRSGDFAGFRDPDYWGFVYTASHKFHLDSVAWRNYRPAPDEGEYEGPEDKPKPGTNK